MFEDIEETAANLCGIIGDRYVISSPVDDPIERAFMHFHVYDDDISVERHKSLYAMIGRHTERYGPVHMAIRVLETVKDRSAHFPKIIQRGKIGKLFFGSEGEQEGERDPEYGGHPFVIMEYEVTPVGALTMLSPQRTVPTILALMIGLGCVKALAALNRAGFVHRYVTPYSFGIQNPPTKENILNKMLILDFSAVLPWPCKPRIFVPFIGSYRYSSVRAHWGREQGPADDVISVLYMVAEMIHGKLPWRALGNDEDRICYIKTHFYKTKAFKKLPRQLRMIYRAMYSKTGSAVVDFKFLIRLMAEAIENRDPKRDYQIPEWLLFDQEKNPKSEKKESKSEKKDLKSEKKESKSEKKDLKSEKKE